jgi:uncharacterized protein YerC
MAARWRVAALLDDESKYRMIMGGGGQSALKAIL